MTVRHRMFVVGVWIKGLDGLLEIAGGMLLLFVSGAAINRLIALLTQHELAEDPRDLIAGALRSAASYLTPHTRRFGSAYLISHGLVKVLLATALLRGKRWAYPVAIVFLWVFIGYQSYRLSYHYSVALLVLTLLDVIIVYLTWREYGAVRRHAEEA